MLRIGLHLVFGERLSCDGQHGQSFGVEHRRCALRFLQVDQTMHQFRQSFGFLGDASGEIFHRIRIVRRVADRLGEQRNRSGRGFELVRHVGDEISAHGFETALLAHIGNENREQAVGDLPDTDVQIERVLRQRLAGFDAPAARIRHSRMRAAMQGNRQLAFAHHAVRGHQFHDVAELRERHHLIVDDAETARFG